MIKDETGYDWDDRPEWEEDDWANLFERDDLADVYELVDGLRDDCD